MIVARQPQQWLDLLQKQFVIKHVGRPKTYLGNDLVQDEKIGLWQMSTVAYLKEAIERVESILGTLAKR